jgi:hypothetical protein
VRRREIKSCYTGKEKNIEYAKHNSCRYEPTA